MAQVGLSDRKPGTQPGLAQIRNASGLVIDTKLNKFLEIKRRDRKANPIDKICGLKPKTCKVGRAWAMH